jgi:hypothetical protein
MMCALAGIASPALAQDSTAAGARKVLRAATVAAMTLDGRLLEAAWATAEVANAFTNREPVEGVEPTQRTEVRVLFDETAVWIGARMFDREPGSIAQQVVRRDQDAQADHFEVGFDSNNDRRTGFLFRVSAANVQRDEYVFDDNERDRAWDAVWSSAVTHDSLGWTAELRIPLSQLRFRASDAPQSWGVNFFRRRVRTNEESHFQLVSRLQRGIVSQFATLTNVVAHSARRIELRPYALGSVFRGTAESGNPFKTGRDQGSRGGLDMRLGIGGQFTLDATINPDFGQVEADPAIINLTAFEQFFEERRPFFVEDAKIFDFSLSGGRNRLYYSRRLGRAPRGGAPGGTVFADVPTATNILGAAKLTGRTRRGMSIGALAAVTEDTDARAFLGDSLPERSYLSEPRAEYGVLRVRQDFNGGASTIGAIGTALTRQRPADRSFHFLPSSAFNAGIDWEHQWGNREWAFFGYFSGSHVRGDSVALIRIQRASNHFFQRPDARTVAVDSSARSMSGYDWRMTLDKRRGTHWTGSLWAAQVSPGFEINDVGFSTRQEVLDGGARISYREIVPNRLFRAYNVNVSTFHNWSHDAVAGRFSPAAWGRAHVSGSVSVQGNVEFLNFWRIETNLTYRPELTDRNGTRGGPLMLNPRSVEGRISLNTDRRRKLSIRPGINLETGAMGVGNEASFGMGIGWRPSARLELDVEPRYQRSTIGAQYVATSTALPYGPTFNRRYLFAEVARRELSFQTRLNAAFSPTVSFQLFAQPLLSAGDYSNYKQLLRPLSFDFDTFEEGQPAIGQATTTARCRSGRTCPSAGDRRLFDFDGNGTADLDINEQDFNLRSLIGNAVFRWEYRPGSTMFLVWQRRQRSELVRGDFAAWRDLSELWRAPTDNTFLLKFSYWFPL